MRTKLLLPDGIVFLILNYHFIWTILWNPNVNFKFDPLCHNDFTHFWLLNKFKKKSVVLVFQSVTIPENVFENPCTTFISAKTWWYEKKLTKQCGCMSTMYRTVSCSITFFFILSRKLSGRPNCYQQNLQLIYAPFSVFSSI